MPDDSNYDRQKIAEIASRILSGEVRPLLGARLLDSYSHHLEKELDWEIVRLMRGVASEVDGLPLGQERQYWADKALREKDRLADSYEEHVGPAIMEAARKLLEQFSTERSS